MAEYNSVNLGRIMPKYMGDYSTNVNYNTLDIVFYEGSSYIATQPSLRQTPAIDSEYWGLISGKGDKGDKGDKGPKGDKGDVGPQGPAGKDGYMPVIGGRNLLLGTRDWSGGSAVWDQRGTVTTDTYRGTVVASTNNPWISPIYLMQNAGVLQVGKTYTFSTYVRNTSDTDTEVASYYDDVIVTPGAISAPLPAHTDWTRVSTTFKVIKDPTTSTQGIRWESRKYVINGQIQFAGYKLEEGNVPTDWTPAPEDADSTYVKKSNVLPAEAHDFRYLASHMKTYQGTWWNGTEAIANAPIDGWNWSVVEVISGNADSTGVIRATRFATNATYSANVTNGVLGSWLPMTPSSRPATFTDLAVVAKSMNNYAGTWYAAAINDIKNGPRKMDFNSTITVINSWNDAGLIIISSQGYNTWIGGVASGTIQHWALIADDSSVVHNTGNETVAGNKIIIGDNTYMGINTFMDGVSLNGKNVVNGLTDTDWLDIPLAEGRTGTAKYKVSLGKVFVHIDGVKGVTATGNNAQGQIGTLPVNPIPYYSRYTIQSGSKVMGLTIASNGVIYIANSMGNDMSENDPFFFDTVLI